MTKGTRRLFIGGAALIVMVVAADAYEYSFDGWFNCLSDYLSDIQGGLQMYAKNHNGESPGSFEDFRASWSSWNSQFPLEGYWNKVHGGYVWNPGLKTADGWPVIVMCPAGSHGLVRRFAWALVNAGGDIQFVRVESNRVVPYK